MTLPLLIRRSLVRAQVGEPSSTVENAGAFTNIWLPSRRLVPVVVPQPRTVRRLCPGVVLVRDGAFAPRPGATRCHLGPVGPVLATLPDPPSTPQAELDAAALRLKRAAHAAAYGATQAQVRAILLGVL